MSGNGQFNNDWAVDQIAVGVRHRKDLGDIDALAESIGKVGVLQPITITPEGLLICGARRLAAVKQLGWRTVPVWVRTGLSQKLAGLMAERDDEASHKPYSKLELAEMYTELKAEIAADAARRQQAAQFVDGRNPHSHGVADSATPWGTATGDSRRQAAEMLGGASHYTLEQIAAIQKAADATQRDSEVRRQAAEVLRQIGEGHAVEPLFRQLRPAVMLDDLDIVAADETEPEPARLAARTGAKLIREYEAASPMGDDDLEKIARAALNRVNAARKSTTPKPGKPSPAPATPPAPRKHSVKQFLYIWEEMSGWPDHYDVDTIAKAVPDDKWSAFKHTIAVSVEFMEAVDTARAAIAFAGP